MHKQSGPASSIITAMIIIILIITVFSIMVIKLIIMFTVFRNCNHTFIQHSLKKPTLRHSQSDNRNHDQVEWFSITSKIEAEKGQEAHECHRFMAAFSRVKGQTQQSYHAALQKYRTEDNNRAFFCRAKTEEICDERQMTMKYITLQDRMANK